MQEYETLKAEIEALKPQVGLSTDVEAKTVKIDKPELVGIVGKTIE
jgi:hypothetical protein